MLAVSSVVRPCGHSFKGKQALQLSLIFPPDVGTGAIDVLLTRHGTGVFATVKRHESSL